MYTPENILALMSEYNDLITKASSIKKQVEDWTDNWMSNYNLSSITEDELATVFFPNNWCYPEALEQNLKFVDKYCDKSVPDSLATIDTQYEELEEAIDEPF